MHPDSVRGCVPQGGVLYYPWQYPVRTSVCSSLSWSGLSMVHARGTKKRACLRQDCLLGVIPARCQGEWPGEGEHVVAVPGFGPKVSGYTRFWPLLKNESQWALYKQKIPDSCRDLKNYSTQVFRRNDRERKGDIDMDKAHSFDHFVKKKDAYMVTT